MVFSGFLDFISLNLLFPLITALVETESNSRISLPFTALDNLFSSYWDKNLPGLGLALLLLFLSKAVTTVFIEYRVLSFAEGLQADLKIRLFQKYASLGYLQYTNRDTSTYTHALQSLVGSFTGGVVLRSLRVVSGVLVISAVLCAIVLINFEFL